MKYHLHFCYIFIIKSFNLIRPKTLIKLKGTFFISTSNHHFSHFVMWYACSWAVHFTNVKGLSSKWRRWNLRWIFIGLKCNVPISSSNFWTSSYFSMTKENIIIMPKKLKMELLPFDVLIAFSITTITKCKWYWKMVLRKNETYNNARLVKRIVMYYGWIFFFLKIILYKLC